MDKIIRGITKDGFVKISAINGKDLVQRAQNIHHTTPTATAALGRLLCAASLMGNLMKEENAAVTLRINGGGPIHGVLAVSDSTGNVRGYVGDPTVDLPLRPDGKLDVSLRDKAYLQMDEDAEKVMQVIEEFAGVLPFNDKASPEIIMREMQMSKAAFKRAVGRLYKERKIEITEKSIRKIDK